MQAPTSHRDGTIVNKSMQFVRLWARVWVLLGRAAPLLSVLVAIVTVLEALAGIAVLYVIKILVDTITQEMTAGAGATLIEVIEVLVLTGAAMAIAVLLQSTTRILRMRQGLVVSDYVDREIHNRAISVDLKYYERPVYYDALMRARQGGSNRPSQIVGHAITMFRASLILIAIFVLLASIEVLILPILLVPILLALVVRLFFTRRLFDWNMSRAQMERRTDYLDFLMTNASHAKDLRLNRIGPHLRDEYRELRKNIREGQIRIEQTRLTTEFFMSLVGAVIFIAASAWLLSESLSGERLIGDVVLFVLLLRRAEGAGNEFVGNVSNIVNDHLYIEQLFDFLAVKPDIAAPDNPRSIPGVLQAGIKLENVSFRYEPDEPVVLTDISLEIPPGQIVALVGENGSGKTTLIKLLTRLYDPWSGKITLEGKDIREFDVDEYRSLMSVIFQNFAMYAESVQDNIRYGDVNLEFEESRIIEAAKNAGIDKFISTLPDQYQTSLTKLFDSGQELSIGQWQRIALARAFYPKSKIVVLDEPTSAVDPKAEFELFNDFRSRLDGRAALLISHRLSTIRQADYTYLLESGKIVEHGTHEELIALNGKYADLFQKQAQHYR